MGVTLVRYEISVRPMVLRSVPADQKLGKVIVEAGREFQDETGREAQVAFVNAIPDGVQEGQEVKGIMLIQANWVESGQIAVGAGGMEVIDQEKRKWRRK